MNKNIVIVVIAIVIVGGGSFYGGMIYDQNKSAAGNQGEFANLSPQERQARLAQRGTTGAGAVRGMRNGGGFTSGQIISKDDKSITLKLQDGGSKIVFFANTTQVMKSAQGSSQDLVVGQKAVVTGTANSDGSVSAQSIQLRSAPSKSQ